MTNLNMTKQHPYRVDKVFYELMNYIKSQSVEEIVKNMLGYYHKLSVLNRVVLENYYDKYKFWGSLHHPMEEGSILMNRAKSLHDHSDDFIWLYNKLSDNRSKIILYTMACNWYSFYSLKSIIETPFSQYFDLDIIKCDENEVFVDVGAYKGETVLSYCCNYGLENYKKIYCYEITPSVFNDLQKALSHLQNVHCRMLGLSDVEETLKISKNEDDTANSLLQLQSDNSISIQTTTLDNDIREPVTFIKMDIEGFEERALKGCSGHIINDKPKLAISVYHSNEDIWKLPRLIHDYQPEYNFYLRYHGGDLSPSELTLLAV